MRACVHRQTKADVESAFVLATSLGIFSPMCHLIHAGRRGARTLSQACLKPPSQSAYQNVTTQSGNKRKRRQVVSTRDIQEQQQQPKKEMLGHHCNAVQFIGLTFPQSVRVDKSKWQIIVKCHYSRRDEVKQNYQAKFCRLMRGQN